VKAIIIGATSGIGRELAKQMSAHDYTVGITGRRTQLLDSLEQEMASTCFTSTMDLTNIPDSVSAFKALLDRMGDVDIVVINSGTGSINPEFPLSEELDTIAVNVTGFTAIANVAYHYFIKRKAGHIIGISSIAAL
jgi:short-subunit dehydrogenase